MINHQPCFDHTVSSQKIFPSTISSEHSAQNFQIVVHFIPIYSPWFSNEIKHGRPPRPCCLSLSSVFLDSISARNCLCGPNWKSFFVWCCDVARTGKENPKVVQVWLEWWWRVFRGRGWQGSFWFISAITLGQEANNRKAVLFQLFLRFPWEGRNEKLSTADEFMSFLLLLCFEIIFSQGSTMIQHLFVLWQMFVVAFVGPIKTMVCLYFNDNWTMVGELTGN